MLIAGQGGAGKSGTTLAGIAAGLDSAGDDYVVAALLDRPRAHPAYRLLKQDPAGLARLGLDRLLPDPGPLNWQGKHSFDIAALGRGRLRTLELTAILIPRIAHAARSRLAPASGREAMLALAPSSIFQIQGERLSAPRFFGELARRLPAFHLELGTEPQEIAATIASFLDREAA